MSGAAILWLGQCHDVRLVGGKAARLSQLTAAGFPVPSGFVITTAAFRACEEKGTGSEPVRDSSGRTPSGAVPVPFSSPRMPNELACQITAAYRQMGCPAVAVRSSATAEDLDTASMAGQYVTILDVCGEDALLDAVGQCWASIHSHRTRAYLAEHGVAIDDVAMAVVVQELVPAETAGVLFTAHPRSGSQEEMLLEASWGLGEAVVSGLVQPDALVLDRRTGAVTSALISHKQLYIGPGTHEPIAVPEPKQRVACLGARDVYALWRLGTRVREHFGSHQDIEWAIAGGKVFLLQSRPITTLEDAELLAQSLDQARTQIVEAKRQGRGDWARHNLSETLPHPAPLTWSVIRRFMSGDGGFGAMYRLAGFEPSPAVCRDGLLDLIAGRIYMDLARAPEMFFAGFPFRYDLDLLRADLDASQGPPTLPAGSPLQQYRVARRLAAAQRRIEELAHDFHRRFHHATVPALIEYVRAERARDLADLTAEEWRQLWRERERKVLDEFAPQSLLPSLIAAMAVNQLRTLLDELFWDEDPQQLAGLLMAGAEPDQTLAANQDLYELAQGNLTTDQWLERYGHRGPEEFDLAAPRWRERPEDLTAMAARLKDGPSPAAMHARRTEEAAAKLAELDRQLSRGKRRMLHEHLDLARRYLRYREDGKHYLMLGYELLRDLALEAGRRLEIGDDVFLLTFDEVAAALETGLAPLNVIRQRSIQRRSEAKLVLGHLITEADLPTLGELPPSPGTDGLAAMPVSAGVSCGPVRIVHSPDKAGDLGKGYVLVCPSTDPSWTPLFINAAALVLECGGMLSHGAVVAREMGIPAVVCPNATHHFTEGELLTVDGQHGAVVRTPESSELPPSPASESVDPDDIRIPRRLIPPVPGPREQVGARLRNVFLIVWGVYLLAALCLPGDWLYRVSMQAMDAVLWPAVAAWGKPAAVGVLAGSLAALTMIGQWLLADTRRLRAAKRRSQSLRKLAAALPKDSPRRKAMERLAAPVHLRLVRASLVPLAVLLGPLVASFLWWLPARVDPASWNPAPGATAYVVASVDGDFSGPVTLEPGVGLNLDERTPAAQSLPPIRATLESRLAQWRKPSDLAKLPWEVQEAGRWTGKMLVDDLSDYLRRGVPPQPLSWTIATPADQPGRFAVTLTAADSEPVRAYLVVGDTFPPEPKEDLGDGKPAQVVRPAGPSPIQWVKVSYFEQKHEGQGAFWTPLAPWGCSWDVGWVLLYVLVYLPVMFALRWLLRIP